MISAIVLAAGLSRRMGANKLLLPLGERTVLGQVIAVLQDGPLGEIVVVTGHEREKIETLIHYQGRSLRADSPDAGRSLRADSPNAGRYPHSGHSAPPLRFVYNSRYAAGEMLSSIQAGLAAMQNDCDAALIVLGDQPQIEQRVVKQIIAARAPGMVIIPTFNRRSGHPILIDRACWPEILALPPGAELRGALRAYPDWLRYIVVDSESVLHDVDTPEDYSRIVS